MKRKVVKHGPSSLIISLPSSWVKRNNIEKGSELDVSEEGRNLVVSSDAVGSAKYSDVSIDVTGLCRTTILRTIRGLYRMGYDTINVRFDNPLAAYPKTGASLNVLSVIHLEVNRLIGFEVIQETEKSCVIKDLESASMKDFEQVLRRAFLLLLQMAKDFAEGAHRRNMPLLETIEERHDAISKFASYCLRLLNKKGHAVQVKTAYQFYVIAAIDNISRIIRYTSRDIREFNGKLNQKLIEIMNELNDSMLREYYELYYNYNNEKIVKINANRYKIEEAIRELPVSVKPAEAVVAGRLSVIGSIVLDLIEARTALEYATGP